MKRIAILFLLACLAPVVDAAELPHGVASGDITDRTAVVWARAAAPGILRFEISTTPGFRTRFGQGFRVVDTTVPVKAPLKGLQPNQRYFFRATDGAGNVSTGEFKTLPGVCINAPVRFGVSGDWRGEIAPYPSIRNVPDRALQFFIGLGDTIYAERYSGPETGQTAATLGEYRARHAEVLTERHGMNTWEDLRSTTPMFAMIDDHEVINDFAGGAAPSTDNRFDQTGRFINDTNRYKAGLTAFSEYMPIENRVWKSGSKRFKGKPDLYRSRFVGRRAMFAMLDARSFRDVGLPAVTDLTDTNAVLAYLVAAFTPNRTMLGKEQFDRLRADLLKAKAAGVTWKFVMVPEPIQNLGVFNASDRFEGYAAERTALLKFIDDNDIDNVVFVAADLHGTMVNNLSYQTAPGQPQIPTSAWEIVTGAVAFEEPFGQTLAALSRQLDLINDQQKAFYDSLPVAGDADSAANDKDDFVAGIINAQIGPLGYSLLGLGDSGLTANLTTGGYEAMHTYGWTEFDVARDTGLLTVTTWGVPAYSYADIQTDPSSITARQPTVVSRFTIAPVPVPGGDCRHAR